MGFNSAFKGLKNLSVGNTFKDLREGRRGLLQPNADSSTAKVRYQKAYSVNA
jgi:hypothetical protein